MVAVQREAIWQRHFGGARCWQGWRDQGAARLLRLGGLVCLALLWGCAPLVTGGGAGGVAAAKDSQGKNKTFGEVIDDTILTAKINTVINETREISFEELDFTVNRGVVTFTGKVPNRRVLRQLLSAVQAMAEVKAVHSELRLDGAGGQVPRSERKDNEN